jgi:hypothetical protein
MSASPLAQLDYAPAPPLGRQRAMARRALGWVGLIVLVAAVLVYAPPMWRQVWYMRGQGRCMRFALPAGQLVYANDAAEATGLMTAGYKPVASAVGRSLGGTPASSMSAGFAPPPLADVGEEYLGYYANYPWGYVRQGVSNAPLRTGAFLHARQNAQSGERLVGVVFLERQDAQPGERRLEINALVWRPATWEPGSRVQLVGLTSVVVPEIDGKRVHVFAGQADPANAAHFTLGYDIDGQAGTIDGWLDAYDRVMMQFRDGPGASVPGKLTRAGTRLR